jgi:hypothetical protein
MKENRQMQQLIQTASRVVTVVFVLALIWAVYQAAANHNPLPLWAWLGVIALFALAVGLIVAVIVYRGVAKEAGPFNFSPAALVAGKLEKEERLIEPGEASALNARIHLTEGVLALQGGAEAAMEAGFTYDDADWKPAVVRYAVDPAGLGSLEVEQQSTGRPARRQGRCEWDLRLSRRLPLDLFVKVGAGKASLKMGGLSLTRLHVENGVGALTVDLSGDWERDLQAYVKAGIGDLTLRLPAETGVRLHTSVSLGSTHPHGLTWDGEALTNAALGKSAVTLDIVVESGIGKVTFEFG